MVNIDRVLITGAYGTKNLGDEKILSGLAKLCRKHYQVDEVIAATIDPQATLKATSVDRAILNIEKSFFTWISVAKDVDLIILGGGSIVGTPFARRHSLIVAIASLLGTKIYVIGGVADGDPVDKETSRRYLKMVDAIAVRDFLSKNRLFSMGIDEPIDVVPDPGFISEPEQNRRYTLPEQYILICIRSGEGLPSNVDIAGLSSALDSLNSQTNNTILFFPFHRIREGDRAFSEKVAKEMDTDAVIFDQEYDIADAEFIISNADAVIAMRLHSMILSASQRTPFTPISYTPKCDAFLEMIEVSKSIDYDSIKSEELVNSVMENLNGDTPISQSEDAIKGLEEDCWEMFEHCDDQDREAGSSRPFLHLLTYIPRVVLKEYR
ncbi:polysaccharide pyruvyl transferase family protein [Halobellus ordinarius]|uniref:polysaccharide pyruvyl transferase family protein n=1 Tax=Halobellus ordinarius TaxID=3075120 RepID=UPI0028809491|nr:polysaccharide pyruvyl transferase family protein [Halobellus sp. ZY16]